MTSDSTQSSIIIRSYQPSDQAACQEIFFKVHNSYKNPEILTNFAIQSDMADIENRYLKIPNGHWWVAVSTDDNRIVGHVAVLPLNVGAPLYYRELPEGERDQVCELLRMAVSPDAQRQNVGSKLLSTLINFAREKGYKQIHLTTLTSMNKACAFYEKNGFTKGRIEKYSIDFNLAKNTEDIQRLFRNPPKPVVFEVDAIIPEEDQRLMKIPPEQSKSMYAQHYSLIL